MEIVKATVAEFNALERLRGKPVRPETKVFREMEVNDVWRFKNHVHITKGAGGTCSFGHVSTTLTQKGYRFSIRHDGPDLLVMRIK